VLCYNVLRFSVTFINKNVHGLQNEFRVLGQNDQILLLSEKCKIICDHSFRNKNDEFSDVEYVFLLNVAGLYQFLAVLNHYVYFFFLMKHSF